MNGRRTVRAVLALAAVSALGLVMMLVSDALFWDRLGFVLSALPLVVGLWRALRLRQLPERTRGHRAASVDPEVH